MKKNNCIKFDDDIELAADSEENMNEMVLSIINAIKKFKKLLEWDKIFILK